MDQLSVSQALYDPVRLHILHDLDLLDSQPDPAFDRITRLVTQVLQAPASLMSLVDAERLWLTSLVGLPEPWCSSRQAPLNHSFCQYVVAGRAPFVVADARAHAPIADSPAIRDLGMVAYAGVPLITPEGVVLGALCAIDHAPRVWSAANLALLTDLAAVVLTEIALRRSQQAEQQAMRAQDRSEARFAAILDTVSDGVWSVDSAHRITTSNQAGAVLFAQLTGVPLQPGAPLAQLCSSERYSMWAARYDRALDGETFTIEDYIVLDGTQHWYSLTFSPIITDKSIEGVIVIGRALAPQRAEVAASDQLAQANAQLYHDEQVARLHASPAASPTTSTTC